MNYNDMNVDDEEYLTIVKARDILNQYAVVKRDYFHTSDRSEEYFRLHLARQKREHFMVVFLSRDLGMLSGDVMFSGTTGRCVVEPVEITRRAVELGAKFVILGHNHPSGVADASDDDIAMTKVIAEQLNVFSISVIDHIIVGDATYSFAMNDLL